MIARLVLSDPQRFKEDNSNDELFYEHPRFVHHLDEGFRKRLTQLYKDRIPTNSVILDLMSSWVSHLPQEVNYKKVIGHGLNNQELTRNNRLDSFWIQNLNKNQNLPLEDNSIDICLMVAAWQYLQYPEQISLELRRVVRPSGKLIVSFSNRAFWSKTPEVWLQGSDVQRIKYIIDVLRMNGWNSIEKIMEETKPLSFLPFISLNGDPFFSILATD